MARKTKRSPGGLPGAVLAALFSLYSIADTAPTPSLREDSPVAVRHLQFIGGDTYELEQLRRYYASHIGRTVPLSELIAATRAVTERYRQDGYPLSYAYLPVDNFEQGIVRVILVEGHIDDIELRVDNPFIYKKLAWLAHEMAQHQPLTDQAFQRYHLLMQAIPGVETRVRLPLPDNPYGRARMEIEAEHVKPWNIGINLDSRDGDNSLMANAALTGMSANGEQLQLSALLPIDTDNNYFGADYHQYVGHHGWQLFMNGYYSDHLPRFFKRQPLSSQLDLEFRENRQEFRVGAGLGYPWILTDRHRRQWIMHIAYKHSDIRYERRLRHSSKDLPLEPLVLETRYPSLSLGMSEQRVEDNLFWKVETELLQGLDTGSSDTVTELWDIDFTRLSLQLETGHGFGSGWSLNGGALAFWSPDTLPDAEQITFGGQRFGRGYPVGQSNGDMGYGLMAELAFSHPLEQPWLRQLRPYLVVDHAASRFNDGHGLRHRLGSYALGVGLSNREIYQLLLELAKPFGDTPADSSDRDWRLNINFSYNFG